MNKKQNKKSNNFDNKKIKKDYIKPQLTPLGDIRDVTMGGSPGTGDSGNAFTELPF